MNAKMEILKDFDFELSHALLKCAYIRYDDPWNEEEAEALLPVGYTTEEYNNFLDKLYEIDYDSGYGHQELFGTLWFKDGTWASRKEYDGAESWQLNYCPGIPDYLIKKED